MQRPWGRSPSRYSGSRKVTQAGRASWESLGQRGGREGRACGTLGPWRNSGETQEGSEESIN